MDRSSIGLCAAALAALLVFGGYGPAASDDMRLLSGEEIRQEIIGNTVDGQMGSPFTEFYSPDGAIKGVSGEGRYEGSWSIDKDMLCLVYSEPFGCRRIGLAGDVVSFITEDGEADGSGTLIKGNPDGL
jgi:hypothetical protein